MHKKREGVSWLWPEGNASAYRTNHYPNKLESYLATRQPTTNSNGASDYPNDKEQPKGHDSADCTTATRSPRKSLQVVNHLPGLTYAGFQGESRLTNPIPACPIAADTSREYVPDLNWQAANPQSQRSVSEKPEKFLVLANHNPIVRSNSKLCFASRRVYPGACKTLEVSFARRHTLDGKYGGVRRDFEKLERSIVDTAICSKPLARSFYGDSMLPGRICGPPAGYGRRQLRKVPSGVELW